MSCLFQSSLVVQNLEGFNDDLNTRLLSALEAYVDALQGTAATNAQATEVVRHSISQVNLDKDSELHASHSVALG